MVCFIGENQQIIASVYSDNDLKRKETAIYTNLRVRFIRQKDNIKNNKDNIISILSIFKNIY